MNEEKKIENEFYKFYDTRRKLIEQLTSLLMINLENEIREKLTKLLPQLIFLQGQNRLDLNQMSEFYKIAEMVQIAYFQYVDVLSNSTLTEIGDGILDETIIKSYQLGFQLSGAQAIMQGVMFKETVSTYYNYQAVLKIQNNNRQYLLRASQHMKENVRQALIKEVGDQLVDGLITGDGMIPMASKLSKRLVENEIKVIDKAGRKWGTMHYAEMVVRTEMIRSFNFAIEDRARLNDRLYVEYPKHRGSCKYCKPFENIPLFIGINDEDNYLNAPHVEDIRDRGMNHPNCRHNPRILIMKYEGEDKVKERIIKELPDTGYKRSKYEKDFFNMLNGLSS